MLNYQTSIFPCLCRFDATWHWAKLEPEEGSAATLTATQRKLAARFPVKLVSTREGPEGVGGEEGLLCGCEAPTPHTSPPHIFIPPTQIVSMPASPCPSVQYVPHPARPQECAVQQLAGPGAA